MNAVLVSRPAHVSAWQHDNRDNIATSHRVKNEFTMKDGTVNRLFVVRGSIDIERLRGYDWDKIVILYGNDTNNGAWRDMCTLLVRQQLPIDPSRLEYKE